MSGLRNSSADNPLTQEEVLAFVENAPNEVFWVQKVDIPVKLTKTAQKTAVETVVVARDGRKIHETSNLADIGYGIDTRYCVDGSVDQYAKKPHKVKTSYKIDDGRTFDEVAFSETTAAHTDGDDIRKAFVATKDLYLKTNWGSVQFVARGGIVTFLGNEAIGNNNPCDMVLHTDLGNGNVVLTKYASAIRRDMFKRELPISAGAEKFLKIAQTEDMKRVLKRDRKGVSTSMRVGLCMLQIKMRLAEWRDKTFSLLSSRRIERRIAKRRKTYSKVGKER